METILNWNTPYSGFWFTNHCISETIDILLYVLCRIISILISIFGVGLLILALFRKHRTLQRISNGNPYTNCEKKYACFVRCFHASNLRLKFREFIFNSSNKFIGWRHHLRQYIYLIDRSMIFWLKPNNNILASVDWIWDTQQHAMH